MSLPSSLFCGKNRGWHEVRYIVRENTVLRLCSRLHRRHTTAMHLLQSGVDLSVIALWLGHESVNTTHHYLEADLGMKERALSSLQEPDVEMIRYQPPKDVLAFLESL